MSFLEIIGIAAGWAAVIFVVVASWRTFHTAQPKQAASGPRRCECSICMRKATPRGFLLGPRELTDVQTGVFAVTSGAGRCAMLGFDALQPDGVGRVCVVITDAPLFDQVVEPAIRAHLQATRSGT